MTDDERRSLEEAQRDLNARRTERRAGRAFTVLERLAIESGADEQRIEEAIKEQEARTRAALATGAEADIKPTNRKLRSKSPGSTGPSATGARPAKRQRKAPKSPTKLKRAELLAALVAAKIDTDVVATLARLLWSEAHGGESCRKDRIPTPVDLVSWLPRWDDRSRTKAVNLLTGLYDGRSAWWESEAAAMVGVDLCCCIWEPEPQLGAIPRLNGTGGMFFTRVETIKTVHSRWVALQDGSKDAQHHPLTPIVDDWQRRSAVKVKIDQRRRAILPTPLRSAHREHAIQLPIALDPITPTGPQQGSLPGLEPPPSALVPVLPLALYDLAGGPMATRGRGAPYAQRMFFEILMSVGRLDRVPGMTAQVEMTYRDLIGWLWPNLSATGRTWDRRRHLPALYRTLLELDGMRIEWERQLWRLVAVQSLPTTTTRPDDLVLFRVEHLPGSDHGPMIDREALRRWGLVSAPAWRAFLRLAYLWDTAKRQNGGARIYATRPVVARGPSGELLGNDGMPLRDRHGALVTDWSDRRAVRLGDNGEPAGGGNPPAYERTPAADRVPVLGPDDLIRLAFDDNIDLPAGTRRKRLFEARKTLLALEDAGQIMRELSDHGGVRILEVCPDFYR